MARCLFIVEDTFFIKTRGLITVPGIIPQGDERFDAGDPILIKRPDGPHLQSTIGGIETFWGCVPVKPRTQVVILLKGLGKEDVPIGSEIWSVDTTKQVRGSRADE
jgi:hypothetical protein